ncbi:hypothetical protein G7Y79_00036g072020 [Physcia stellaris]|nr:hypothetical protein G7Y79_00036g072020 [Physcia stellaris]
MKESEVADMFRPPVNRTMRILDRSYFQKKVPLAAARVLQKKQIAKCRQELANDMLKLERKPAVRVDPFDREIKALLLRPEIKSDDDSTWSEKLRALVREKQVDITNYDLELTYDDWTYYDIMSAILPEEELDEIPTGFTIVGHVAHLNLRDSYLHHRHLLATVLLDKNPTIRTVINKTDMVGSSTPSAPSPTSSSPAFPISMSKFQKRARLVELFKPGEAVCDVMAGVGPFAVPAAKKKVFVWANDLNPECHQGLKWAIEKNKVSRFVRSFCEDGHDFIRKSTKSLLSTNYKAIIPAKVSRKTSAASAPQATIHTQPKTFAHYIMNLPASAIIFLPNFIGLYRGHEGLFTPHTGTKLPMIHVYCFNTKSDDNKAAEMEICREISEELGYEIKPGDEEVTIWDVRDVSPQKRYFCTSFRLPASVAFR